jgi:imidazoleglycerol-phosphate dehydratase/histidinol-phosphatase
MRVVFIDRDGTVIVEPPDEQVDSLEKFQLVPGAVRGLRLLLEYGYDLIMVTNQDNLGTSLYPEEKYELVQNKLTQLLSGEGITFSKVFVCPHGRNEGCICRKPKTGLVDAYIDEGRIDLASSFVLGDRETDVEFARNLGCRAVRLTADSSTEANFFTPDLYEACRYIARSGRSARAERKTSETDISVEVSLGGEGSANISTGIGFFDHMLAQLSKHSGIDMNIKVKGDLNVDEHHSVEDTGLVLGEAIRKAAGDKRGIGRYGFLLPMDESLAQVALDFGGRAYCSFSAKFRREKIGDLASELIEDFFRAFADGLRANLHIKADGRNDHHKAEAIFKSVARALGQAVARQQTGSAGLPSTKGII